MHERPPIFFTLAWITCLSGLFLLFLGERTVGGAVACALLSAGGFLAFHLDLERQLKYRTRRRK